LTDSGEDEIMAIDNFKNVSKFVDEFYRAKQTAATSILLAEKITDLLLTYKHDCEQRGIPISDGMDRLMGEISSLLKRISLINSLPMSDLTRLAPISISPNKTKQNDEPNEDETESGIQELKYLCQSVPNRRLSSVTS
jgi:hypothetical protein